MPIAWRGIEGELKASLKSLQTSVPDGVGGTELRTVSFAAQQAAALLAVLETAGNDYDQHGIDGLNVSSPYTLWWGGGVTSNTLYGITTFTPTPSAAAAWGELDRLYRFCWSEASPSDQASAASAFGVTGTAPPLPLPPDVTGVTASVLAGRVSAALAMTSVSSTVLGLLMDANARWAALLSTRPVSWPIVDLTITALQAALANARAFLGAQAFR